MWFAEVIQGGSFFFYFFSFFLTYEYVCQESVGVCVSHKCVRSHAKGISVHLCWKSARDNNPVITASVLALQRLTVLFYSDLYNQCHISNTTNEMLRVLPNPPTLKPFTHTCTRSRTHTYKHSARFPSYSQLATILCQTDVN